MSLKDKGLENYFTKEVLFKFKDVKEAVEDYYLLSTNWTTNNSIVKRIMKKYDLNDDMSRLDCYKKIFGDWKE